MESNSWKCPECGEIIETFGPATLRMEIASHNRALHPASVGLDKPTWICPEVGCGEKLERSNQYALEAAIRGHKAFKHRLDQPVYSGQRSTEQVSGTTPVTRPMFPLNEYDRAFLKGVLIQGW